MPGAWFDTLGEIVQIGFLFFDVLLPIFIQIGAGFYLQKHYEMDMATLSKIQFYILVPAITFTSLYSSEVAGDLLIGILLSNLALFLLLLFAAFVAVRFGRVDAQKWRAFYNSVCLYNSGNYCIPLIQLLYTSPLANSVQIIIMLMQGVMTNTFGVLNTSLQNRRIGPVLKGILLMPMTIATVAAIVFRAFSLPVWKPAMLSMQILSQGMVPLALVTLGAQLANTRICFVAWDVYLSSVLRLLVAPFLAWILVRMLGMQGVAAQVIIICSAAPSAVNTVLLAIEFGGDPEFATQSVLSSTLLSALTVPLVIGLCLQWV